MVKPSKPRQIRRMGAPSFLIPLNDQVVIHEIAKKYMKKNGATIM